MMVKGEPPASEAQRRADEMRTCVICDETAFDETHFPFIFCSGCDLGCHLECVGEREVPAEDEPWYCRPCRKNKTKEGSRACRGCGRVEPPTARSVLVSCSICWEAWHASCAQRTGAPTGKWVCPFCLRRDRSRERQPVRAEHRLDKKRRRGAIRLMGSGVATRAEVERLLEAADAPATKRRKQALRQSFMTTVGQRPIDQASIEVFAATRVKRGAAAATILQEIGMLAAMQPEAISDPHRYRRLKRAVLRNADVAHRAKLPIRPAEVTALMASIQTTRYKARTPREAERMRLRDLTFFSVLFSAIPRASELSGLRWACVKRLWLRADDILEEGPLEKRLSGGQFVGLRLYFEESKTDPAATGQHADLELSSLDEDHCAVKLLLRLWAAKRAGQQHVFADQREDRQPVQIQAATFRSIFRRLARGCLSKERLGHLSLHSFRKGGTTTARDGGATIEQLKAQGRWRSAAHLDYTAVEGRGALVFSNKVQNALAHTLQR